jgi:lysyl-tRNA synthetase class II
MSQELSQVLRVRREKLAALEERGIAPFAYGYDRSHRSDRALALFQEEEEAGTLDEGGRGAASGWREGS